MSICPNCGKETSDSAKFCIECGASLEEQSQKPGGEEKNCEHSSDILTSEAHPEEKAEIRKLDTVKSKIKFKKKYIPAAIFVIAIVVIFIFLSVGKSGASDYTLYMKDRELFYNDFSKDGKHQLSTESSDFLFGDFEDTYDDCFNAFANDDEVEQISNTLASYKLITVSENGSLIFYLDNATYTDTDIIYDLYYCSASKPDKESTKIASKVTGYKVNTAATIVTYSDEDGNLWQYDVKKDTKEKIDTKITYTFNITVSDDANTIIYKRSDGSIYKKQLGKDKEKIVGNADDIEHISEDFSTIYYTKDNSLYVKSNDKDTKKIGSNVYRVYKIFNNGNCYYTSNNAKEISVANYVEDDLASMFDDFKSIYEYAVNLQKQYSNDEITYESYESGFQKFATQYETWWKKYVDDSYPVGNYSSEVDDSEWTTIWYEFETVCEHFDEYIELKDQLQEKEISINTETLYFFDGKNSKVVTEDLSYLKSISESGAAVYEKYDFSKQDRLNLSDISDLYDWEEREERIESSLYHYKSLFVFSENKKCEIGNYHSADISNDGKTIICLDNEDNLYITSLSNGEIQKLKLFDKDVESIAGIRILPNNDILYFKESSDYGADLYINKKLVDYNVFCYKYTEGNIVYLTDFDPDSLCGTLKIYKNGESTKVYDDVFLFIELEDNAEILFISDYNPEYLKGDLYASKNNKIEKIDIDVNTLINFTHWDYIV